MNASADALLERVHALAGAVPDPEIPVVTLGDLGILRSVTREQDHVVVTLTPTYTGCPATEVIRDDVQRTLTEAGLHGVQVRLTLSPPWTTDWISSAGRRKLREYGIAPPGRAARSPTEGSSNVLQFVPRERWRAQGLHPVSGSPLNLAASSASRGAEAHTDGITERIECPRCGAVHVECVSEYGSTPCKALYRCLQCREPFDYFKPY